MSSLDTSKSRVQALREELEIRNSDRKSRVQELREELDAQNKTMSDNKSRVKALREELDAKRETTTKAKANSQITNTVEPQNFIELIKPENNDTQTTKISNNERIKQIDKELAALKTLNMPNILESAANTLSSLFKPKYPTIGMSEEDLKRKRDALTTEKAMLQAQELAEKNKAAGLAVNLVSNLSKGLGAFETAKQGIVNKVNEIKNSEDNLVNNLTSGLVKRATKNLPSEESRPVNTNSAFYLPTNIENATREGLLDGMDGIGRFVAETGLSVAQVVSTLPFGSAGSLFIMSTGAASQTAKDVTDRGGTAEQAMLEGAVAGLVEVVTEKLPIDNLFEIAKTAGKSGVKQAVGNILKQMGLEATEEVISQISNTIADRAIMREKSEYELYAKDHGYGAADRKFFGEDVLLAAAGGALSGGVLGTGGMTAGRIKYEIYAKKHGYDAANKKFFGEDEAGSEQINTANEATNNIDNGSNTSKEVIKSIVDETAKQIINAVVGDEPDYTLPADLTKSMPLTSPYYATIQSKKQSQPVSEFEEIQQTEPIQKYSDAVGIPSISTFETTLINQGMDDISRKVTVDKLVELNNSLKTNGKNGLTIEKAVNNIKKLNDNIIKDFADTLKCVPETSKIITANTDYLSSPGKTITPEYVKAYADTYSDAMKKTNSPGYTFINQATDGKYDVSDVVSSYILNNTLPDGMSPELANSTMVKSTVDEFMKLLDSSVRKVQTLSSNVYGVPSNTPLAASTVEESNSSDQNVLPTQTTDISPQQTVLSATLPQTETKKSTILSGSIEYEVSEDVDTRNNQKIFVMKPKNKVENFAALNEKIKELGGYYYGKKKGFIFQENPADKLNALTNVSEKEPFANTSNNGIIESVDNNPTQYTAIKGQVSGKVGVAYTSDNKPTEFRYAVVPVSELIASHDADGTVNQNYPQELQPRNRERYASQKQINDIARNLNPALLGESGNVADGAPVVGQDGIVESGNGRIIALKEVFKSNAVKADEYRQYLKNNAEKFGINPNNISEDGVLVRIRTDKGEFDRAEFATKANESSVSSYSASEIAITDAKKLTPDILDMFSAGSDGDLLNAENRSFVKRFINEIVPASEQNRYISGNGSLTQEGLTRIRNAVFQKAYGDTALLTKLSESLDDDTKNLTKALLNTAPKIVQLNSQIENGSAYPINISKDITEAAQLYDTLKSSGMTIDAYDNQLSIVDKASDEIISIAKSFEKNKRSVKAMTEYIIGLLNSVEELGNPNQMKIFNEETIVTKSDIIRGVDKNISQNIANFVKEQLVNGEKLTSNELFITATKEYGGTMADNAFTSKDAYDAMELGVNQHILDKKDISLESIQKILDLLPTQTKRTEGMDKFQQFSTPPSIAYLANYAANVTKDDIMLEPSAGIGGIAVFAKKDGAVVYANELDPRRLEVLKNMPFDKFFNEDAEQINNILGDIISPTVIVMNPPFSSSGTRNVHDTKIGAKHIEQALKILAPNGRLVAIVGQGMSDNAPAFKDWWKKIKAEYNVRANVGIDGANYNKYGTNFGIQMLVIDKDGSTTSPTKTAFVKELSELQGILEGIRNERPLVERNRGNDGRRQNKIQTSGMGFDERGRPAGIETNMDGMGSKKELAQSAGNNKDEPGAVAATREKTDGTVSGVSDGKRQRIRNVIPDAGGAGNLDHNGNRTGSSVGNTELERRQPNDSITKPERSGRGRIDGVADGNGNAGRVDGNPAGQSFVSRLPVKSEKKELTDSIFEAYQPRKLLLENAKLHPANISESAAMNAIEPPPVTYKPNISQDIIDKGILSDVQLEAVTYAGQSHKQTLPDGTVRGFFLGDGTGVGKGRTIAGIILDSFNNGAKKAVWLSMNDSLANDAKRDIAALFGDASLVVNFDGGKKAEKSLSKDNAILFVTYGKLKDKYADENSNFKQLVNWLGKDFDGVIAFDEAHKMGNAEDQKGERGTKKATLTGLSGVELQKLLPKAKIVYSSATGATNVENLLYAERLGLWGEGTPFVNGRDFVAKIKAGGIAAMELVARDLKSMGVYASRNISYDDVKYDRMTHKLTKEQRAVYDELARAWQITLQNINQALEATNQAKDGQRRGRVMGAFWGAQQRFFNQIITSAKLPSLIADMQKQLDNGNSVVVQLTNTNEAQQERELAELIANGRDIEELDLTPVKLLQKYIEHGFPIEQYELFTDEKGNQKSRRATKANGEAVINREMEQQRDALLNKLASIKAADNPLDQIINHFGADIVAESTGRTRRIILKEGKKTQENRTKNAKDADIQAFQDGKKRVMIFSEAGGTGKSYHADLTAKNQQHRVHYLLQAGWKADAAVQGFGRTHRSNQASAPTLVLAATDLRGEARFISTIAKRLDQLGALTKGQRQTGGQGLFSAADNFEGKLAGDVLAAFYRDLLSGRIENVNGRDIIRKIGLDRKLTDEYGNFRHTAEDARKVSLFLNRILTLESHEQNAVFEAFSEKLQTVTEKAMLEGTLDKGLENYKADKIELNEVKDIHEDKLTGAKTKYYSLTAHHKIKPVRFADVNTSANNFMGFYKNKISGSVRAVFKTSSVTDQYGNITDNYKLTGQVKNEYIPQNKLYNWEKIADVEAEELWNEEIKKLPEYGKEKLNLISGVVLPVWDKLPSENVRIYRVLTSDGDLLIGRVIPDNMIDETLRLLGASRTKEKIATEALLEDIKKGDRVYLENGWRLLQRRVSNENRIEIIGADHRHNDILIKKGVFTERIQYQTRYFIPAEKDTVKVLNEVLSISPVLRTESKKFSIDIGDNEKALSQAQYSVELQEFADAVLTPLGIKLETFQGDKKVGAYYDRRTNTIWLNANSEKSYTALLGHELYHSMPLEDKGKLAWFFRSQSKTDTPEFKAYKDKLMKEYQKIYDERGMGEFTERNFWEEFAAGNCETLFTNENFVEKLMQKSRNLAQKILDFIRNLLKRIFGKSQYTNSTSTEAAGISAKALAKAEKIYADALNVKSWNISPDDAVNSITQVTANDIIVDNFGFGESNTINTAIGGNFSIMTDSDGNSYVEVDTDQHLFDGADVKDYPKIAKKYIREKFQGKIVDIENTNALVTKRTAEKYTFQNHPDQTQVEKNSKMKAATELDNLLKVSQYLREETPNHHTEVLKVDRYITMFAVGGKFFVGEPIVFTENNGTRRIYDIANIKETLPQSGAQNNTLAADLDSVSSDNIISRGENNVKSDIKYSIDTDENSLTPERMKEIRNQFDKDRTDVKKTSPKEVWGERFSYAMNNIIRVFPDIPERGEKGTFFAEFRKMMIQWKALPKTAMFMSQDKLNQITLGLTPQEFKTFSELVYFLDLQEEAKVQQERGYSEILLPNGIDPREVDEVVKAITNESTPKVMDSLEKRKNIWKEMKDKYISLNQSIGFDVEDRFTRENYYRHQVIEHMTDKKAKGDGNHHIEINAGRGWLKERKGSTKAINTDFLAVEYKSLLQMQYDIYIAGTLNKIKEQYDIKPELEKKAFQENRKLLEDMITAEATKDGEYKAVNRNGRIAPDSEIDRQREKFNRQIMFGFNELIRLAKLNRLNDFDGEFSNVVDALKNEDLNAAGLYKYVGTLAGLEFDEDSYDDGFKQSVISARTVLKYTSQKNAWIKSLLGKKYQTWESIAESMNETHSVFQPRRGNYFYTKEVVSEDAFNKAFTDMINGIIQGHGIEMTSDIKELFSQYSDTVRLTGAAYEQWVLPREIVTTMNKVANPKQVNSVVKLYREIQTAWKGWSTSLNPLRTIKYGIRNLLGDLDAVIAGNPMIVAYSKRAVNEIYNAMRNKKYSSDFMEWVERGGYSSMIFANEMDSAMQDKLFSHLKEKTGKSILSIPIAIGKGYVDGVEAAHNFREAILRYSAYLYFKDNINKNDGKVKDYTASNSYIVRGLKSSEDKAYQLSKDLLGAYDEIGMMGQTLRQYWIPFYSFAESNIKRYVRLFENTVMNQLLSDDKKAVKAGKATFNILRKLFAANLLMLLMIAWNKFGRGEDEEKLPPSVRERPHITLGSIGDNVYAFTRPGSFSELLEWVGLDDYKLTKEDLIAPVDKAWGMITPFAKVLVELPSGLNFYPQLTKPRAIRDKAEHIFNSLGLAEVYELAAGKPTQGIGNILENAVVYKYDYKQSAYYEVLDRKREFQKNISNTIYAVDDKSNALYYMKLAVKYKDKKAALKYLDQYFENGGTGKGIAQSFEALNPMYGFTGKDTMEKGQEFIKSLTDNEKAKLKIAQRYYESDLMLPANVAELLRKKDITNQEAKNLLTKYINSKTN